MYSAQKELTRLKKERLDWLTQNAIAIQAAYRGYCVRKQLLMYHGAATVIQASYRRWLARKNFLLLKDAVATVEKYIIGKKERKEYLDFKAKMKIIQLAWKKYLVRKKEKQNAAAIKIQCCWRICSAKKELYKLKKEKLEWLTQNAIVIQAAYRGYYARKQLLKTHQAAAVIQASYRRWLARKNFLLLKKTVATVELYIIGKKEKKKYLDLKAKIRIIQQAWKKYLLIRTEKRNAAAVRIQCCWRMYSARKELMRLKEERLQWLMQNSIVIQAAYRGYCVRKQILKYQQAAIVIQASCRRWLARKKFMLLKKAVATVERFITAKQERIKYLDLKAKARIIQQAWKEYLVRKSEKQNAAAIHIQCCWRIYSAKKKFTRLKMERLKWLTQNAIVIQAAYRGHCARKQLLQHYKAAAIIQASYRRWITRKKFILLKKAVATVELYIIGKKERRKYLDLKAKIRIIQNAWRKYIVRKRQKQNVAAVKIQYYWRMHSAKQKLTGLKRKKLEWLTQNAIVIQAAYRGYSARKQVYKYHQAAVIVQASYRRWLARKNFLLLKKSVAMVERYIIGKKEKKKYLDLKMKIRAVRLIQQTWRKYSGMKREKQRKQIAAAVRIQCCWKVYSSIKELTRLKKKFEWLTQNAIVIQAAYRGYCTRKQLLKCHKAAIVIQASYRRWFARRNFILLKKAVSTVELYIIGKKTRRKYVDLKGKIQAVRIIEQAWRTYVDKEILKKQNAAAIRIQSYWRMYSAKKKLTELKNKKIEWLNQNATVIQAWWRACLVRHSITDKNVIEARRKILAADTSEAKKLKNRTSRSLDLLFKDTLLHNMLTALQDLDVCTKLSPNCCVRLIESGGLTILIRLVRVCNRSVPHMEIIKLTTNVLLNLAKYEKTVTSVWEEEDSVDTVLHLMMIYREKGTAIFTKCCTLLWIFCQDPTKAQVMKENASFIEQIRSFHNLLTKKQSIEAKRLVAKSVGSIATRSFNTSILPKKMNASIMQKNGERESLQIDPDWILGKHRHREFKDPILAVTGIMKSLNLKSKKAADV